MAAPFRSAAATLIACVLAGPGGAVTVSEADANLMFLLKKVQGAERGAIKVGAAAALNDQGTLENPGGNARSDHAVGVIGDPLNIGFGDGVRLASGAWTAAIGPSGLGDAFAYTDGAISIRNASGERARLKFVASFDLSTAAGVEVPDLEAGYARASVGLESASFGVLFHAASEADTVFGPVTDGLRDRLKVTLRLDPGEADTLYLVADTESQSASLAPVPVPPALALLLGALGALAALGGLGGRRP
jgi:hypothetical protein